MTTRYEKEQRRKRRRAQEHERRRSYQRPVTWRDHPFVKAYCALAVTAMILYLLITGDFEILDRDRFPSSLFD